MAMISVKVKVKVMITVKVKVNVTMTVKVKVKVTITVKVMIVLRMLRYLMRNFFLQVQLTRCEKFLCHGSFFTLAMNWMVIPDNLWIVMNAMKVVIAFE